MPTEIVLTNGEKVAVQEESDQVAGLLRTQRIVRLELHPQTPGPVYINRANVLYFTPE
jgi:hypothetical protein